MGLLKEIWQETIVELLYPDNSFIMHSTDASEHVSFSKVTKPNEGAAPEVDTNRTVFPAPISELTDERIEYNIRTQYVRPVRIRNAEQIEISYDKRASVLRRGAGKTRKLIGDYMAYDWAPTTNIRVVYTTGALVNGKRLVTPDDITTIQNLMNDEDIPDEDRHCLLPNIFDQQLKTYADIKDASKFGLSIQQQGRLEGYAGFNFHRRSNTLLYSENGGNPIRLVPGATLPGDEVIASIFWHKDWVERAIGETIVNPEEVSAANYGAVISSETRAGGEKTFHSEIGVFALIQATS